jgi:hypothetical protein
MTDQTVPEFSNKTNGDEVEFFNKIISKFYLISLTGISRS